MKITEINKGIGDGYVKTLSIILNPGDNSGEAITLSVDVYDNGDGLPNGQVENIIIDMHCYGTSSAKITLWGIGIDALSEACQELKMLSHDKSL